MKMSKKLSDYKILITGASGSLGKQLIHELVDRGIKPIVHVRENSDTDYIDSHKLEKRIADLRNEDQLEKLVEGVDMVIHTAAWVNFRQDRLTQFTGINTMGALAMYNAARKAGVKRFLHVSTVAAVAGMRRNSDNKELRWPPLVNEELEFNLDRLRIPYILTKHAAEVELRKAAAAGDPELVIVNPSIMIAPSRTGDDRRKATRWFSKLIMPDIPVRVNLVDIRDVAPGILAALARGRNGERYILAGDNITARELVLAISAVLAKLPHLVRFPRAFYDFLARVAVTVGRMLGRRKVSFYPDLVKMLDYDWAYSSAKAREELGYRNRSIFITLEDLLTNNFTGSYIKEGPNGK